MRFWLSVFLMILMGCDPARPSDRQPPVLLDAAVAESGEELTLSFDEPVVEAATGGDFGKQSAVVNGDKVSVPLPPTLKPGKPYRWSAEVSDAERNVTGLSGKFYGPNDHPAALRLNEVRIAGSGAHTDLVELRVEAEGSLGGWTVDAYSSPDARQRYVFGDRSVTAGDFVVLHLKPSGDASEKDEWSAADESGGSDARPTAWDYWVPQGKGLSAVKGVVVLRPRPDAAPADALLYSRDPGGAAPLAQAAGWSGRDELNPEGTTATRTWSRTDEAPPQWILTANGGATPGRANKLMAWAGPSANRKRPPTTKRRPGLRRRPRGAGWPSVPATKLPRGAEEGGDGDGRRGVEAEVPIEATPRGPFRRRPREREGGPGSRRQTAGGLRVRARHRIQGRAESRRSRATLWPRPPSVESAATARHRRGATTPCV